MKTFAIMMGGEKIQDARGEDSKLEAMLQLQKHVLAAKQERRVCALDVFYVKSLPHRRKIQNILF